MRAYPRRGVDDRAFEWTTGRLSGGGSSINGEQYVRPTADVMEQWEHLLGSSWSPEQATRIFKQLEKFNGETSDPLVHGYHGRVDIRQAPVQPTAMAAKLVSAIERATGFQEILDYNDPDTPVGPFTRWQLYQQPNGNRESSSTAFLSRDVITSNGRGVNGRKLRAFYKCTALRILFENKRAIGIEFLKRRKMSPCIRKQKADHLRGIQHQPPSSLMLSGIGPAEQLRAAGIPIIFNNPHVGKRLRNHTLNFATFSTNPEDPPLPADDPSALYTGGAFLPNPTAGTGGRRAVQLIGIGAKDTLTIAILYLKPKSRGTIRLQSNDPLQIVLADEAFLQDEDDLEAVKNIYRVYIKNIAAELQDIDPSLSSPFTEHRRNQ